MNLKVEEDDQSKHYKGESITQKSEVSSAEPPKDYEAMLQKLEAEVRNHIRVEQQLKLHIETMQFKMEECDWKAQKNSKESKQIAEVKEGLTQK